jgi:hypothetical protein
MNEYAKSLVLARAIDMWQAIDSRTVANVLANNVINIPIRNVGLIKRLVVEISFTLSQAAAETLNRTTLGLGNVLSQVIFTDLSNQTRINTSGWHLHWLASLRRQGVFGAAVTTDTPTGFGSNFAVISGPAAVTAGQTIRMMYEIPISYGDFDLRGGIYASVVNSTMNLQLTVNPNLVVGSAANPTLAAYQSTTANDLGTITNFQVTTYQNYLDQVPMSADGPVLPLLDLSTAYLLNNTVATGMSANQDFAIPYANFRDFLSTFFIYDNFGGAGAIGTQISALKLQSANYTNIINIDPFVASLLARNIIRDDLPTAVNREAYLLDSRRKPISTVQYGNMQAVLTPANVAGAASRVLVGYESLAIINQVTQAGSLYNT